MLSPILALFARISKPLWLNIRTTVAEVAGGKKTFSSNGCSTLNMSLCATSSLQPKTKTETDRLEGLKTKTKTKTPRFTTKTETKTCKNGSRDVSRPRPKSRKLQVCAAVLLLPHSPRPRRAPHLKCIPDVA